MLFSSDILEASDNLHVLARARLCDISCAESCTGGLVMAALTEIPGASVRVKQGFVTYHNQSKQRWLGVSKQTLADDGAVSLRCAAQMAYGVVHHAKQLTPKQRVLAIAVTGIAGSNLNVDTDMKPAKISDKPDGLVYIAHAIASAKDRTGQQACLQIRRHDFLGNRHQVRMQSVLTALRDAKEFLADS